MAYPSQKLLHVFRILLVLILIIVVVVLVFLLLVFGLLRVVLLLLFGLFHFAQFLPLFREAVCLSHVISDDNVVEDSATLHLPEIEANETEVRVFINGIIILVFWVRDLLRFPEALVGWVGDPFGDPLALELWIVLHWRLPLAILL